MPPSISVREHIKWADEPASEPTKTIVLTSPGARFVDLRILKDSANSPEEKLPFNQLDWAIAGFSSSEPRTGPGPDGKGSTAYTHATWKHWISSRTENVEGVADEGDNFDVGEDLTLEKGEMENPSTGIVQPYEELWRDVEPLPTEESGGKREFAVIQVHDDTRGVRGSVVRLGHYCQGMLRVGKEIALERWEWRADDGWKLRARMGDLKVPCALAVENQSKLNVGSEVDYGEYTWEVIERGAF